MSKRKTGNVLVWYATSWNRWEKGEAASLRTAKIDARKALKDIIEDYGSIVYADENRSVVCIEEVTMLRGKPNITVIFDRDEGGAQDCAPIKHKPKGLNEFNCLLCPRDGGGMINSNHLGIARDDCEMFITKKGGGAIVYSCNGRVFRVVENPDGDKHQFTTVYKRQEV